MLLQEPTQGVDVNAKNDIYRIIENLSLDQISILIASSEIREMINICDRIIVMNENRLVEEFTHENFSLENSVCAKDFSLREISFGDKILLKCQPPSLII